LGRWLVIGLSRSPRPAAGRNILTGYFDIIRKVSGRSVEETEKLKIKTGLAQSRKDAEKVKKIKKTCKEIS
jgi:hypothetical protein